MKEKKFENERFITRGVEENLNPLLVMVLWELIDSMTIQQDYLQVFELSEEKGKQKIEHVQEDPEYKREYLLDVDTSFFSVKSFSGSDVPNAFVGKLFVIDDDTHSTMLLAEEY